MNIKYYADIYKKSLKADKTAATIEGYSRTLDLYMKSNDELTTASILAWRTEQSERVSLTSLNLYCQHLMYFCKFIKAMEGIADLITG